MTESQFEKLLKTLKTAERERDFSRHTVGVQDGIINEVREENERLRVLVARCIPFLPSHWELTKELEKEVGDE